MNAIFGESGGCVPALALSLIVTATQAGAQIDIPVPSQQPVKLLDVLTDETPGELWLRFRFLAPQIGEAEDQVNYEVSANDMDHLCNTLAIPYVAQRDLDPARVVISMSDRSVEFGTTDPKATQFFESYRLEGARCVLEEY